MIERDVSVEEDLELTIILPEDEGTIDIFLQDDGAPLDEEAQVVVLDENGREMVPNTPTADNLTIYLPSGAIYTVMAQYQATAVEGNVVVRPGGLHPVTIDFSEDPGFSNGSSDGSPLSDE